MQNKETKKLPFFGIPAIFPFLLRHGGKILGVILFMSLVSVADAIFPLFQNYAITHYIGDGTTDTLAIFVALYILLALAQSLCSGIGCFLSATTEVKVIQDVRQACFDHIQELSFSYFNQNSVGYIHSRVISDPNRIGILASWCLLDLAMDTTYIIGIFVVMFFLNPVLCLILALLVPLEFAATVYFQRKLKSETEKVREQNSIITGNYNQGIIGAKTIKTLGIEAKMQKDFEQDTEQMRRVSIRAARAKSMFHGSIVFCASISLALVLWRGGLLTRDQLMLIGSLSVFMNYATSMGVYIQDLVHVISNVTNCQVNIERIIRLLHTESDVVDSPQVIDQYGDTFHPKKENWEELYGDVEFSHVDFRYPDGEEEVLTDFNLKIPQGSMVAIVGETGAGKSTLVNLVCRFYEPTGGQVLIDGRDVKERSQLWLHSHIGYVLQSPHLFSGTILENLRYGNPDADMETIETAIRRVHAEQVIAHAEHGYDSQVGEGGDLLSTGEKQLLSFARALLADPRILILDEATSSVDTLTESYIQDAIKIVTEGRTSFVVAHRLSTIRDADLILAMKDGRIVEQGTHEELMALQGYYYHLSMIGEGEGE